jgi:hypothetical protein
MTFSWSERTQLAMQSLLDTANPLVGSADYPVSIGMEYGANLRRLLTEIRAA